MAEGTKERILDIALELFAQNGYLGTSMSDIAKQLGFTKAALYKHYASKQEILDQIVERMNRMERAMLCHSADPEYRVWEQETDPEGSLTVQERLEPHETALIEVEQIL